MQEVFTNEELFDLISYGIKGVHYTVTENGGYATTDKSDAYPQFAMNTWCWKNPDFILEADDEDEERQNEKVERRVHGRIQGMRCPAGPTGRLEDAREPSRSTKL